MWAKTILFALFCAIISASKLSSRLTFAIFVFACFIHFYFSEDDLATRKRLNFEAQTRYATKKLYHDGTVQPENKRRFMVGENGDVVKLSKKVAEPIDNVTTNQSYQGVSMRITSPSYLKPRFQFCFCLAPETSWKWSPWKLCRPSIRMWFRRLYRIPVVVWLDPSVSGW